LLNLTLYVVTN